MRIEFFMAEARNVRALTRQLKQTAMEELCDGAFICFLALAQGMKSVCLAVFKR
jgi:hypothetical protein